MLDAGKIGVLTVCLVFAHLAGGMTHATIPHDHGHSHGDESTTIWQDLHAALRHEDKKVPFAPPLVFAAGIALAALTVFRGYVFALPPLVSARDPVRGAMLRRGIISYRRFR